MVTKNENKDLSDEKEVSPQDTSQESQEMQETKDSQEIKVNDSTIDVPINSSKTSADIEKEKRQFKSGNMKVADNQAENLYIIQNAIIDGNLSFGNYAVREVLQNSGKVNKEYDLSDAEQFTEFCETVKAGEHFATAIILCVFEYVELDVFQDFKSALLLELPPVTDNEGKEITVYQNPYLSINSLLKTINGEMVVLESGEHCIRLAKNRSIALKNLWQQFPEIRRYIARWLLKVCDSFKYRTNFDTAQITAAFVNIIKLDFNAGIDHFFPRLYSTPNKYWLLGFIASELYDDTTYRDKILPYINKWIDSNSSWLWKPALYIYSNIEDYNKIENFEEKIRKVIYNLFASNELTSEDSSYIGMLLIASEHLRSLITFTFNNLMTNLHNYNKKYLSCLYYLELLQYEYYLISSEVVDLPLVVCDKKQQLKNLLPLLETIMSRYDTRHFLFVILESYLKEISLYSAEKKTINRIKAYFQLIAESNQQFHNDISLFLKKCDCNLAKELSRYLDNTFLPASSMCHLN